MYQLKDVKTVQVEISSYCNAACPQCPRNVFGGNTISELPLNKWSLEQFDSVFPLEFVQQLETFYFCGTYGDPMTNRDIGKMCHQLRDRNPTINIGIHTNGSIGHCDLYSELASTVNFIAFGIDGLEDTNHVYRRKTDWNKIMEKSAAFIDAGGHAIWDFIVFEHNEHQVEQARQLSAERGFKEFCVKKTGRFLNRLHEFSSQQNVLDANGVVEYTITLPKNKAYINDAYSIISTLPNNQLKQYLSHCEIHCNADRIKELYLGADGFVFPCGWLHDRLYGPEIVNHKDHDMIKTLMNKIGGWQQANVFHTSLDNIVDHGWFRLITESWHNEDRLERCAMMCGSQINVIGPQNHSVRYKK